MAGTTFTATAKQASYDVIIIGGAIMGASTAWFLTQLGFDGSILVVERDPSYESCSTAHSNSCMRQQFSTALNVKISQFAAEFVKTLPQQMNDPRVPQLDIQNFGYMYLADSDAAADSLRASHAIQQAAGAGTQLLTRDELAAKFPYYMLDDIVLGSHNTVDEGYWDGGAVFDWFRRSSRERGVEFVQASVTGLTRTGGRIDAVTLDNGQTLACGQVVNAAGPRAAEIATMAGIDLPVEPRKRFTWVVNAEHPVPGELPLTIDPSGVHVRQDGPETYMIGAKPDHDIAVDPTDFAMDHSIWENTVWPAVATRIPQFESLRIVTEWAGHYAYNTLDQNAVLGPHDEVSNFHFINGFSGHGLQQAPAMGRGLAELICFGEYRSLDMSPFGYNRIREGRAIVEEAVI